MPTCQDTNCTNKAHSLSGYRVCREHMAPTTTVTAPAVKIHKASYGRNNSRYAQCGHNTVAYQNTHHNLTDDNNEVTCTRCLKRIS